MKKRQHPQIRRTVAHELLQRTVRTDKPEPAAITGGIAVRTDLKAGLLLTALLLQQQAASDGGVVT